MLPEPTAHRGKLLSGRPEQGVRVYAGCFIRKREIILEQDLLLNSGKLRFILIHEIFHFVWARLSNELRSSYGDLLKIEVENRARGELGESASLKKALLPSYHPERETRRWHDYLCESFCDTAAWLYSGLREQPELTLGKRWRLRRKAWFQIVAAPGFRC